MVNRAAAGSRPNTLDVVHIGSPTPTPAVKTPITHVTDHVVEAAKQEARQERRRLQQQQQQERKEQKGKHHHQVLFLMGIEGSGHHGMKKVIPHMGDKVDVTVIDAGNIKSSLRPFVESKDAGGLAKEMLRIVAVEDAKGRGTMFLFKGSLPGRTVEGNNGRGEDCIWDPAVDCMVQLATHPVYDLAWVWAAAKAAVPNTKAVFLNRDFTNIVASHEQWDGTVNHTRIMAVFLQYIQHILKTAVPADDWVRLEYESFAAIGNGNVVTSLAKFLGWDIDWSLEPRDKRASLFRSSTRNATTDLPKTSVDMINAVITEFTTEGRWPYSNNIDASHALLSLFPPHPELNAVPTEHLQR
jgi:hypothetical protein